MDTNRRQIVLLGAILALLAGVLYWQSTRQEQTPEEFAAAARQSAGAVTPPLTDAVPAGKTAPLPGLSAEKAPGATTPAVVNDQTVPVVVPHAFLGSIRQ